MDMRNESARTLADGVWLPFRLLLLEGGGGNPKPISSLTRNRHRFAEHLVQVTELLPLQLLVEGEMDDLQLRIFWDDQESDEESATHLGHLLTPGQPLVLYSVAAKEEYPWRCGRYRFKVQLGDEAYYGGFEIVPKNINAAQLKHMHQLIEKHVQGLIYDFFHLNFQDGSLGNPGLKRHLDFYKWYSSIEKNFLNALKRIEKEHDWNLLTVYLEESRPSRPDFQSVRWMVSAKGHAKHGTRFLNRRMTVTNDILVNRFFKWRVKKLEKMLSDAKDFFKKKADKLDADSQRLFGNITQLEEQIEQYAKDRRTHRKFLEELEGQLKTQHAQYSTIREQWEGIAQIHQALQQKLQLLRGELSASFWRAIHEQPVTAKIVFNNPSYLAVDKILRDGEQLFQQPKEGLGKSVPAQRPTPVLYEYYVFFTLVEVAQELGWKMMEEPRLTEQTMVYEGLPDGYTLRLRRGEEELRLVYNEEVFYGSNHPLAKSNHGYFYSIDTNRKPDIRLERHRITLDEPLQFQEAWIVEVKYRPLYYIYSEVVMTDTAKQLMSYSGYRYTWKSADGKPFPREQSVVKKVICVYPGTSSEHEQVELLSDFGAYYLQLCPDGIRVRGRDELCRMMKEWLG